MQSRCTTRRTIQQPEGPEYRYLSVDVASLSNASAVHLFRPFPIRARLSIKWYHSAARERGQQIKQAARVRVRVVAFTAGTKYREPAYKYAFLGLAAKLPVSPGGRNYIIRHTSKYDIPRDCSFSDARPRTKSRLSRYF